MRAVKWSVDRNTSVEIKEMEDGDNIFIYQGDDAIILHPTGTSAEALVRALLSAIQETGFDWPNLDDFGFEQSVE